MTHPPRRRGDTLALHGGSRVRDTPLPYARQTIEADDLAVVSAALDADWITQGPAVVRFERALAERAGVGRAVAVASGTAALHLVCRAAGFGAGDEVVTTSLTFATTANAIVHYSLVYNNPFYRKRFRYGKGLCATADAVELRLVTLPLFPAMTDADQDDVLRALDKIFAHYAR